MERFIYRPANASEWNECMELAWRTFLKFEAEQYTPEGVENFKEFVTDDTLETMFHKGVYQVFVALENDQIVGVISIRNVSHISLLFVDEHYHKNGVGRGLIEYVREYMISELGQNVVTVNAAPYAYGFYHKMGFIDRGLETTTDGITYTPMELYL